MVVRVILEAVLLVSSYTTALSKFRRRALRVFRGCARSIGMNIYKIANCCSAQSDDRVGISLGQIVFDTLLCSKTGRKEFDTISNHRGFAR